MDPNHSRQPHHLFERHGDHRFHAQGDHRTVPPRRADLGRAEEGVVFEDGYCRPASSNVGEFPPLSIAEIAGKTTLTLGAIAGHSEMNVTGAGPGFGVHIVDVEVDQELGRVDIKRYTVVEDAGKAIHRLQVEGQYQGGAPCRASAGRSTRSMSMARTDGCRTRASSTIACRWRPMCR